MGKSSARRLRAVNEMVCPNKVNSAVLTDVDAIPATFAEGRPLYKAGIWVRERGKLTSKRRLERGNRIPFGLDTMTLGYGVTRRYTECGSLCHVGRLADALDFGCHVNMELHNLAVG